LTEFLVQELNEKDNVDELIRIHKTEISQGFLSSLGNKALRLLFSHAIESSLSILLVAKDPRDNEIIGFLFGTVNTNSFYRDFILKRFIESLVVFLPMIISFNKIYKIFEILLYPTRKKVINLPKAELLDIAVKEEYQGKGVARILFKKFLNILINNNISEFKITTGENLIRAQRFYEKLGAKKATEIEVHKGQKTIVYIYKILKGDCN